MRGTKKSDCVTQGADWRWRAWWRKILSEKQNYQRLLSKDKTGRIPDECAPILERLECNAETWLDFVKNFCKRIRNEADLPQNRQHFRFTRRQAQSASGVS